MNNFGTIFKFELAKIFKKRVTMITLLVLIGLNFLSWLNFLMRTESTRMVVEDDGKTVISKENTISGYERMVLLRENAKKLDGMFLDETMIKKSLESDTDMYGINEYAVMREFVLSAILSDTYQIPESAEALYFDWKQRVVKSAVDDYGANEKDIAALNDRINSLDTPFRYTYGVGWEVILGNMLTLGVETALAVAVVLSTVFSDEHRRKTDAIILCTKKGRSTVYYAKILASALFGICVNLISVIMEFFFANFFWGLDGFDGMIQFFLTRSSVTISVGEATLLLLAISFVAAVLESIFVAMLSECTNNGVVTMAIMTCLVIATQTVNIPVNLRTLSMLWGIMPTSIIAYWGLEDMRLFFGKIYNYQMAFILFVFFSVVFYYIGKRRYIHYEVDGR